MPSRSVTETEACSTRSMNDFSSFKRTIMIVVMKIKMIISGGGGCLKIKVSLSVLCYLFFNCHQVMQTLSEAEKVCVELQHSVSGLDSRLAELLHWETEARELYHLLRATDRQQKQVQTSQARVR